MTKDMFGIEYGFYRPFQGSMGNAGEFNHRALPHAVAVAPTGLLVEIHPISYSHLIL